MRTIDSPGVEINENDLSLRTDSSVGTTVLVHGFAPQGPINELILVSDKTVLNELFFGDKGPTNAAERYFHSSCDEILNSPASLMVTRLPYGSGDGTGFDGDYSVLAFPISSQVLSTFTEYDINSGEELDTIDYDRYYSLSNYTMAQSSVSAGGWLGTGDLPEISTVTYSPNISSLLMITNDENTEITLYQINPNDVSASYVSSWPMGLGTVADFHDVEGMCWVYDNVYAVVEERLHTEPKYTLTYEIPITYFNLPATNGTTIDRTTSPKISAQLSVPYGANRGPEGITYNPQEEAFYIAIEGRYGGSSDVPTSLTGLSLDLQPRMLKLDLNDAGSTITGLTTAYPASATTDLFLAVEKLSSTFTWTTPPVYFDFSDVYYDYITNTLYTLTDKASGIIHTDLSGNLIEFRSMSAHPSLTQTEGIAFSYDMSALFISSEPQGVVQFDWGVGITQLDDLVYNAALTCVPISAGTVFLHLSANGVDYFLYDYFKDGVLSSVQSVFLTGFVSYSTGALTLNLDDLGTNNITASLTAEYSCYTTSSGKSMFDVPYNFVDTVPFHEPYVVPITQSEYHNINEGSLSWVTTGGAPDTYEKLGNAAFLVLNKARTTINEDYEGYYIGLTDNRGIIEGTFESITEIKTISSGNTKIKLDSNLLEFPLTGVDTAPTSHDSISKALETSYSYDFTQSTYRDTLLMSLFKLRSSENEPEKLSFIPLEEHIGSFESKDQRIDHVAREGDTFFLENRVNQKSNYIEMKTNPKFADSTTIVNVNNLSPKLYPIGSYLPSKNVETPLKHIGDLPAKITRALALADEPKALDVDITIGAGLETVWAYVAGTNGVQSFDDTANIASELTALIDQETGAESLFAGYHNTIFNLYEVFCSLTRKDCIYYSDPLRAIFIQGEKHKTLDSKNRNYTSNIYTPLKNLYASSRSSYSATYANWVQIFNNNTGKFVWVPFSGWQAAITARMDALLRPWYAPFGLTNGRVPNTTDIALSTTQRQQDMLYRIGINPIVNLQRDGIVVWGQKTLLSIPSVFDRLNVRRLFITLERDILKILKYFVGDPNTVSTRSRIVNALKPLFELAKNNEGCYDYKIVCDSTNNTSTIIDENTMKVDVYIKPVRTAEFILVTFYNTRTDQSFSELVS